MLNLKVMKTKYSKIVNDSVRKHRQIAPGGGVEELTLINLPIDI